MNCFDDPACMGDAALNCHHPCATAQRIVPFDIYNTYYRKTHPL
jgi:hypothetical protein